MPKFDIEAGFISKLLEIKDTGIIKDARITPHFFTGDSKSAYKYIYDVVLDTGEVPTVRAFKRKFPHYDLETHTVEGERVVGTDENISYWCNELRNKKRHNTLSNAISKSAEYLQDFKAPEALTYMKQQIAFLESEIEESTDVDITKNTLDRKREYLKRKENQGMRGLPTGIPFLDYAIKGLEKETLITLIANTGVGKTWLEVYIGAYCMLQNCRVLHFITEMSESSMRDRYEAMLFSMCYGEMNYANFKSGKLPLKVEKQYFEFLENDLPSLEPLELITVTGVMSVSAGIEKYKPDLVLIDGAYLMEDDHGAESDWLRVAHITRDLKKLAKRAKVPIFINNQADKNTSKKTGPELGDISYTQAIGQDSDIVLALFRDQAMIADKEMMLKVLKSREGERGRCTLNWDFDTMNFSEIFSEGVTQADDEENDGSDEAEGTLDIMT